MSLFSPKHFLSANEEILLVYTVFPQLQNFSPYKLLNMMHNPRYLLTCNLKNLGTEMGWREGITEKRRNKVRSAHLLAYDTNTDGPGCGIIQS